MDTLSLSYEDPTSSLSTSNQQMDLPSTITTSTTTHLEFLHHQQQQQQQQQSALNNEEKLPLKYPWGTYFYKADKQRDWKQNVIYITSINYVEDFWSFYTHTYGLRDLSNGSDYMLFKVMINGQTDRGGKLIEDICISL